MSPPGPPAYSLIEANHRMASRFYAHSGHATSLPGALAVYSGADSPAFNIASLTPPPASLPATLNQLTCHYDRLLAGSSLWLCEQLAPHADPALLRQYRYRFQQSAPGLLAGPFPAPRRPAPSGLTVQPVRHAHEALAFAHLVSVIFHVAFPLCQRIYANPAAWRAPAYGWLAYRDQEPVGCAMVTAADGVAGFYSVGTLPQYQGRGYGEVLMRHAAHFAATRLNCHQSVLQSSPDGRRLYNRLGFREFTTFTIYQRAFPASEEQANGNDF